MSPTNNPSSAPPSNSDLLVVVATYNEIENLPALVDEVFDYLPQARVLVIDDNSPDGTGRWCDQRNAQDNRLQVIHRGGKLGLGSATTLGLVHGLDSGFDLIATMDADFSHAPTSLSELVTTIEAPANAHCGLVIGSRYVDGGKIIGWPWFRHLTSRMVNWTTRALLRVPTRDSSGAFRVYRAQTLRKIDLHQVQVEGYAYLQELIWRIHLANIPILEIPITFTDRAHGASKTSVTVGISVFWHLLKIALGRVK